MTTWGLGDYPAMAERLLPAAKGIVDVLDLKPDENVVDLACGTGNAAILAAVRGARVIGLDFEPALLEVARRRAQEDSNPLDIRFAEADAADTGLPDGEFDVVMSIFGVMYVLDHQAAARELVRLCRPGGIIVLASWAPDSFLPQFGRVVAPYLPPPPEGSLAPARWGDLAALEKMFETERIYSVDSVRRSLPLKFDFTEQAREFMIATSGHVLAEKDRLMAEGRWNDLMADVGAFLRQANSAPGNEVVYHLDYLVSIIRKPHDQGD